MMRIFKKNNKFILGMILGLTLASCGVYAITTIAGSNITYSNTKSGLTSTDVQGAIDELYEKADIRKVGKFVAAYTYNESGANKCITGDEETCKKTTCYKVKTADSCPAGTIIKYKVNDTDIVNFHVMFDNGSTMTMQSQRNTIYNTPWYESVDNTKGPITILPALENATAGWTNVNNQTYTLGTTDFSGKGAYTGCMTDNRCYGNTYTLDSRTAKARMMTYQEAVALGCTYEGNCPIWMLNYLENSTELGGTVNDITLGHWMMNAEFDSGYRGCFIFRDRINCERVTVTAGTRAVIEVSK